MEKYYCDFEKTYNKDKPYLLQLYSYTQFVWQEEKFLKNVLNQSVKVLESLRITEQVPKEITLMVNITTDELDKYDRARFIKKLN